MKDYVVIIGGANIDMLGVPFNGLSYKNSAPGSLKISYGGVGRNIAENLARLGVPVKFITVFGSDAYAKELKEHLISLGVDVSYSMTKENENSSYYLCLTDKYGEMQYALSSMEILNNMDEQFFLERKEVINSATLAVVDTNLGEKLKILLDMISIPVCLDTVSAEKALNCKSCIKDLFFIKPNREECCALLNKNSIDTPKDIELCAELLRQNGIENVIVSLGKDGVYYTNGKEKGFMNSMVDEFVSSTGAGDSFFAGVVSGFYHKKSLRDCVYRGSTCAKITIADKDSVSKNINKELFYEEYKN